MGDQKFEIHDFRHVLLYKKKLWWPKIWNPLSTHFNLEQKIGACDGRGKLWNPWFSMYFDLQIQTLVTKNSKSTFDTFQSRKKKIGACDGRPKFWNPWFSTRFTLQKQTLVTKNSKSTYGAFWHRKKNRRLRWATKNLKFVIFVAFYSVNKKIGDQKYEIRFRHISISRKRKSAPAMGDQHFEMHDFRRVLLSK